MNGAPGRKLAYANREGRKNGSISVVDPLSH